MSTVSLYIRLHGSRKYEKASMKGMFRGDYPAGTIFVLRYVRDGKRVFETLKDCPNLKTAQQEAIQRSLDLMRGNLPAPAPKPDKPVRPPAPAGVLMLDVAIDRYLENVQIKAQRPPTAIATR